MLIDLERRGWRALSSTPQAAVAFYEQVLDDEVTMLLPGGAVLVDRTSILGSMAGQPWSTYRLEDFRVLQPNTDTAIITYAVDAERGSTSYSALISCLYVRRPEAWKLAFSPTDSSLGGQDTLELNSTSRGRLSGNATPTLLNER